MKEKIFSIGDMDEEYIKGMECIISFCRKEGIICKKKDNCGECRKVDIFFNKRIKEIYKEENSHEE